MIQGKPSVGTSGHVSRQTSQDNDLASSQGSKEKLLLTSGSDTANRNSQTDLAQSPSDSKSPVRGQTDEEIGRNDRLGPSAQHTGKLGVVVGGNSSKEVMTDKQASVLFVSRLFGTLAISDHKESAEALCCI